MKIPLKFYSFLSFISIIIQNVYPSAIQVDSNNIDKTLENNDIVFLNFYANWCRFSQMLEPIWTEFADKFERETITDKRVAIVKIDCDSEPTIASRFQISKYPTLKLYRYGAMAKKEYRGARNVDAFMTFLREQIQSTIRKIDFTYRLNNIDVSKKGAVIGFFDKEDSENYRTFNKMANVLRDTCSFVVAIGEYATGHRTPTGEDRIVYRSSEGDVKEPTEQDYTNALNDYDLLHAWVTDKCTKLVREITFENAEELTEEGLPFLILFYKPEDTESVKIFEHEVARQLKNDRNSINPVYGDGHKFSHPLHHLGKTVNDLPVMAIDSFRHMYLFPDFKKIEDGHSLNQFVQDLHSGKLHREFHNGPDPTTTKPDEIVTQSVHLPKSTEDSTNSRKKKKAPSSDPPESVFRKLQPSRDRYTIIRDEF